MMGDLTGGAPLLFSAGAALALGLLTTPMVRRLALLGGVVDRPDQRRAHSGVVPTLGGLAVAASFVGALLIVDRLGDGAVATLLSEYGWHVRYFVIGGVIVLAAGVVDDALGLPPWAKLVLQIVAAGVAVFGGYGVEAITNPLTGGEITLGPAGRLFTVAWIVAVTNAFNLIDGLDGLASGVAFIAAVSIILIAQVEGRPDAALLASAFAGALLGFLRYNFHPASIFLGDSGSQLLGYSLSLLSIQGLQKGATTVVIIVPILALGLPLLDTAVTILRRLVVVGFAAVFRADREHIHHRLVAMGMTQRRAVLVLYAVCSLFGAVAFLSVVSRGPIKGLLLAGVALATLAGIHFLGYRRIRQMPTADHLVEPLQDTTDLRSP
jgi:UDP-GlcNAc:undecaprenyl-phosphate GlcNAc-1-phosphate transferase